MSKNFSKILLAIAVAGFAVLPLLAMAAGLQLETNFPKAPSMQEIVTGKTQLPGIIRYMVDWSIIIAALVTVVALVAAGIAYLTSRGRPEATKAAKDRIKNCIYGLLIIAGSFLVLQTINPQLTIMTIQKQTINSGEGVVMFTQAGLYGNGAPNGCYDIGANNAPGSGTATCFNPEAIFGINVPSKGDNLDILIKAGAARYLNYDIANTIAEFGNFALEASPSDYVTSVSFPLYGLGFFGGSAGVDKIKVFAYANTQFNGSSENTANKAIEYRAEGKMKQDGTIERAFYPAPVSSPAADLGMKFINIHEDYNDNFKSRAPYSKGKTIYDYNPQNLGEVVTELKAHPPLSIRQQGGGSGVFLYAYNGGMKNFTATVEDFNVSNVKFDNQADDIEVRNLSNGQRNHDFLAILHSGYFFTGEVRAFFEQHGREDTADAKTRFPDSPPLQVPTVFIPASTGLTPFETKEWYSPGAPFLYKGAYCTDPVACNLGDPDSSVADNDFLFPTTPKVDVGNEKTPVPPAVYQRVAISEADQFGRLTPNDKASSLELFEIEKGQGFYWTADGPDSQKAVVCREVKLCTSKGYLGDCLVFVPNLVDNLKNKFAGARYDSIVVPMPLFTPVNIPKKMWGSVKTYNDAGATVIIDKQMEFNDKIKSISIDGDCAVVLFENGIKDINKCFSCAGTPGDCKDCWDGGGPGANSEVFTSSVADLTTHEISKCGGREKFGFGERKNCASSIAIFPIKKTNDQQGQ
ncbi:MAG: pilin [Candidatus Gribaldobacteria bacterium]|nr:pilin [Candidatus Gribaldobacteria bacterium]